MRRFIQRVHRWRTDRCDLCGLRFRWKRDGRHGFGNRGGREVFHQFCIGYRMQRDAAQERLTVFGVVMDLAAETGLTERDVKIAIELQATDDDRRVAASNEAFRVFYALKLDRDATALRESSHPAAEGGDDQ